MFSLNENDLLGYVSKLADTRELAQEIARRVAAGKIEYPFKCKKCGLEGKVITNGS